jgi:phosphoribosylamine--glycine ligase
MRILILGSGGREHTLAWKFAQENGADNVYVAPGNGGTAQCANNIDLKLSDFDGIKQFCLNQQIDVLLPGSEDPIASGIRDFIEEDEACKHIYVFSPDKEAAQLESSKAYAKAFMQRHRVPTAAYTEFTKDNLEEGYAFLDELNAPYVLKADGLAAGKGVLILDNLEQAKQSLKEMVAENKFGAASDKVVIEEFLDGIEFSIFALTDGKDYVLLPEAKDYKRIGEGDTGLNTGGMGAVSPVPFFTSDLKVKTINEVVEPTIKGLAADNLNYRGFVFFGLIAVNGEPKVIEYNVRMGDPETEVVIPRLASSLSHLIKACQEGNLATAATTINQQYCTTVFSVSGGYPEAYEKGKIIRINKASETIFHAGTKSSKEGLVTSGGRVLAATAFGTTLQEALKNSYQLSVNITFEGRYMRTDIGKDLLPFV